MDEHDYAREQHKIDTENTRAMVPHVFEFSLAAIKSLGIVNGGSIIAILGMLSAEHIPDLVKAGVVRALPHLGAGLLFATVTPALAYISQTFYQKSMYCVEYKFEYPYVEDRPSKRIYINIGIIFQYLSIVFVLASCITFSVGLYQSYLVVSKEYMIARKIN